MKPEIIERKLKIPETEDGDILVVKVGTESCPASPKDIRNIQKLLAQASVNPDLSIVTHHAIEFDVIKKSQLKNVIIAGNLDLLKDNIQILDEGN